MPFVQVQQVQSLGEGGATTYIQEKLDMQGKANAHHDEWDELI
jgi:hypothetical protein